jgi:uncharacterized protein YjbI with pentapeptide repeats
MEQAELNKLLKEHELWLKTNGEEGNQLNLKGQYLIEADFMFADLRGAELRGASLRNAYFYNADLRGANLSNAKLLYTKF